MLHERSLLGRAFILSLILHAAVIAAVLQFIALPAARRARPDLMVTLRIPQSAPADPAPVQPLLLPPQDSRQDRSAASPAVTSASAARPPARVLSVPGDRPMVPDPGSPPRLTGDAALKAAEQLQRELPYPREAIERGLQGEALVLLFLDASGNAMAARIETGSGHAILDEAAVRAARTLRALPDSAPREVLLQVRFRLR